MARFPGQTNNTSPIAAVSEGLKVNNLCASVPQASLVPVWSCFCRQAGIIFEKVLDSCSGNHCCFQNSNHSDAHWWNHVMMKNRYTHPVRTPFDGSVYLHAICTYYTNKAWGFIHRCDHVTVKTRCNTRTMQISTTGSLGCKFGRSFSTEP